MKRIKNYAILCFLGLLGMGACEAAQPDYKDAHLNACRAVIDAANRGGLEMMAIKEPALEKVDVNNDGLSERVEYAQDSLSVFSADGHVIEIIQSDENDWSSDNLQGTTDLSLINYGMQVYILGKADGQPHYLAHVDKNNIERVVCEFGYRKNPVEALIKSSNDRFCQAVLSQSLEYAKFDRQFALSVEDVRASGFQYNQVGKLAAYVDINNDGEKDYVIGVGFIPVTGWSCEAGHLWVLNKARNKQDAAISQQLPEWICGNVEQAPFIFEGQVYIKAREASGHAAIHRVVRLKQGHLDEVCQFSVRATYYIRGEYERILANAESSHVDPWEYALNMPGMSGLQAMLDAKHDPHYTVRGNNFGTVVHEAIRAKQYDKLEFLLKKGVSPNIMRPITDPTDMPPLFFAIWQQSEEAIRLLVKHGANKNQTWAGGSPIDEINFHSYPESEKVRMRKAFFGQ